MAFSVVPRCPLIGDLPVDSTTAVTTIGAVEAALSPLPICLHRSLGAG
jgi:hypothetical protein